MHARIAAESARTGESMAAIVERALSGLPAVVHSEPVKRRRRVVRAPNVAHRSVPRG